MAKYIVKPLCRPAPSFLGSWRHLVLPNSEGNPLIGDVKYTGYEKFAIFDWSWRLSRKQYTSIYAYIRWCRTTKFSVITHMGEGQVLRGQPRHSILHKCVARFVTDSWVCIVDNHISFSEHLRYQHGRNPTFRKLHWRSTCLHTPYRRYCTSIVHSRHDHNI